MPSPELARLLELLTCKMPFNQMARLVVASQAAKSLSLLSLGGWDRQIAYDLARQLHDFAKESNNSMVPFAHLQLFISDCSGAADDYNFLMMAYCPDLIR